MHNSQLVLHCFSGFTVFFLGKLRRHPGKAPLEVGQQKLERLRPLLLGIKLDSETIDECYI